MRFFSKKAVILLLAVLTVFLLANSAARGKYRFELSERIVTVILAPIESFFAKIGYGIRQAGLSTSQMFTLYQDNQALRMENEQLRRDTLNNNEILVENMRLRSMLDFKKATPQFDYVGATVIARDPSSWTSTIIVNKGTENGITKDMPVVTTTGLVGNVVQAFGGYSKVQLVTDPRSAVGSLVQRPESRVAGIVEGGTKGALPRMVNLARDSDVIKGDVIITSGFGGIYPKGLLIGEVVDVVNEEGGLLKYASLKPAVDFDRLEEVMIIVRSREPQATVEQILNNPGQQRIPTGKGASP